MGHRQSRIGRRRISRCVVQIRWPIVRRGHRVCLLSLSLSLSCARAERSIHTRDAQGPFSLSDVALILSGSRAPCDVCAMHYSSNDEYDRCLSEGGYRGGPKCSILRPRCGTGPRCGHCGPRAPYDSWARRDTGPKCSDVSILRILRCRSDGEYPEHSCFRCHSRGISIIYLGIAPATRSIDLTDDRSIELSRARAKIVPRRK